MQVDPKRYPQFEYAAPPKSTRLVLIRHGQSIAGTHGQRFDLLEGHGDPPLSERGQRQAERVGERLSGESFSAVYASSLTRTQQSAAPLAAKLGLTVEIEPDLREVFLGIGEGGLLREMAAQDHPAVLRARANREWGEIPEAETNLELTERVVPVLEAIHARHCGSNVAVFCHGGVIGAVVGHVLSVNPYRMAGARNGSITEVVRTPTDWILRSFNDAAHIGSLFADHP